MYSETTEKKNIFKDEFLIFFLYLFVIFFLIKVSPSFYGDSKLDFDSQNYISSSANRLSLYPWIINIFGTNNLNFLINFQTLVFSISLAFLIIKLRKRINTFWLIIFCTLIFLNFFYLSFCKVILTECFFFSFINFIVALLLDIKKNLLKHSLFISLLCGLLISFRPEGIILASIFFLIIIIINKFSFNFFLINLVMIMFFPIIENIIYHQKFDDRKTVFENVLVGKLFMISSSQRFKFEDFPEFDENFLRDIQSSSIKIKKFINKINNPYLKSNLITDYEAISQYELRKMINYEFDVYKTNIEKFNLKIFLRIIYKYPWDYIKLTLNHYFSMCTPGGRIFLLEKTVKSLNLQIPYENSFKNLSGNIDLNFVNKNLLFVSYLTSIFMFFYLIISLFAFIKIFTKDENKILYYLILSSQCHLFAVSFFNIGSIRYVMPVYSIILLTSVCFLNLLLSKKKSNF